MDETQINSDQAPGIFCVRLSLPAEAIGTSQAHERQVLGFAEACLRLTPRLALRSGGEGIFLDLKHLSAERLRTTPTRLRWLAKRFELKASAIAPGHTARAAWLATLGAHAREPASLPIASLIEFLDPFQPDSDQARATQKLIATLQALGIHSVAHFLKLPEKKLSSRFGRLGLSLRNALTFPAEIWPVFLPPEKISESFQLTDPETQTGISGSESLLYVLTRLGEKLFSRLRGRALRASVLSIELLLENQEKRLLSIRLLVPQSSITSCLPTLRERLTFEWERKAPLPCPAIEIRLAVEETAPGGGTQHDFFSRQEREEEATEALLLRLQEKLGPQSSYRAQLENTHEPERSWSRSAIRGTPPRTANAALLERLPRRPSRLSLPPKPLPRDWRAHALKIEGPERILRSWWQDPTADSGPDRDYFRVLTREGEKLWIYVTQESDGNEKAWLQGWFD